MIKLLTEKGMRILAAIALAVLAFSCQVPESEREPEVLEMIPSQTNPSALESSITVQVKCDLHWSVELEDSSWGTVKVTLVNEGSGGSFSFDMGVNTSEDPRENTLVVKAGKGEIRKTITQGGVGTLFKPRSLTLSGTQEASVTFNSPSPWTAQVAEGGDWLQLKTPSGQKGSNLVTVAPKDANENVGSRSGVVRITVGNNYFDIPVTQGQTDVIVLDGDTKLAYGFEAQEFSVLTKYNVDYEVKSSVPWISPVTSKAPLYERIEYFTVEENSTPQARSGEIRFTGGDAKPMVITVTQEGKDPVLAVTQPGFYGIEGVNYVWGTDGWNQRVRKISPDNTLRYGLFNASQLTAAQLSGVDINAQKGDSAKLKLKVKAKRHVTLSQEYPAVLLYQKDGLLWYKVSDQTYFVLYNN